MKTRIYATPAAKGLINLYYSDISVYLLALVQTVFEVKYI